MEDRGDTISTAGNLPVGRIDHLCEHSAGIAGCVSFAHLTLLPDFLRFCSQPG